LAELAVKHLGTPDVCCASHRATGRAIEEGVQRREDRVAILLGIGAAQTKLHQGIDLVSRISILRQRRPSRRDLRYQAMRLRTGAAGYRLRQVPSLSVVLERSLQSSGSRWSAPIIWETLVTAEKNRR
jgi:hypothetical protein